MDNGLVYMIGNGRVAAAFSYGEMIQAFGPPYASPSLFKTSFAPGLIPGMPRHDPQSAVWHVSLEQDGAPCAVVTDFAAASLNILVRRVESRTPVSMTLAPYAEGLFEYAVPHTDGAVLLKSKNGNAIYNDYPLYFPQFYLIFARGDVRLTKREFSFDAEIDGTAELFLIAGPSYPEACETFEKLLRTPYEELLASTHAWWKTLFDGIPVLKKIPADAPRRDELIRAIEDTVLCVVVQQSDEGGVLAGYNYHLGYVRDQFGVSECLLRLGMLDRAGMILAFYCDVFDRFGKILNAQAMGVPGVFHFAENDAVEITGYLILQFFRYADASGDRAFLQAHIPFLKWLYKRQESELYDDTLPFNGDETYIAGGLLSRDALSDGSAEATLLFVSSGTRLADFLEENGEDVSAMRATLDRVRGAFNGRFIRDGHYYINDPDRDAPLPAYRYGVCMNVERTGCFRFGWTKHCGDGMYLCPLCAAEGKVFPRTKRRYELPSSLLMPAYLRLELPEIAPSVRKHLEELARELKETGFAYAVPAQKLNVGYDYGLLLCNLLAYGLPGAREAYDKILDIRDGVGVWSEYYAAGVPFNTRFRPWESAINLDALIQYAVK